MFSWEHHVFTLKSHYKTDLWVHSDINVISGVTSNFGPRRISKMGPQFLISPCEEEDWIQDLCHALQMSPLYLVEMMLPVTDTPALRGLRSATRGDLIIPSKKTVRFGSRSFNVSGPTMWNSLPVNIRHCKSFETFGKQLKAFLYLRGDSC